VFLRRTMRGLSADLGLGDLEAAAETGVRCLGWSDERAKREMENYCLWIKLLTLNSDSRANRF
jgi:hypothetical protein